MLYCSEAIKAFLPHRDPFLFLDTIESIDSPVPRAEQLSDLIGAKIVGAFFAASNLDFFKGHFPNRPVVPGVLQIEMMAQCSVFLFTRFSKNPFNTTLELSLVSVLKAKFRKEILPDTHLEITSIFKNIKGKFLVFECDIKSNGQICSESEFIVTFNENNQEKII